MPRIIPAADARQGTSGPPPSGYRVVGRPPPVSTAHPALSRLPGPAFNVPVCDRSLYADVLSFESDRLAPRRLRRLTPATLVELRKRANPSWGRSPSPVALDPASIGPLVRNVAAADRRQPRDASFTP